MNYRCENDILISNLDSLYSSETGVNSGIRSGKNHLSD
jgi:hypothetical protein